MAVRYSCVAAVLLIVLQFLIFSLGCGEFANPSNREKKEKNDNATIKANLAKESGLVLPDYMHLVHIGGNQRLDDDNTSYREWILFSNRPAAVGKIMEAGADPGDYFKDFPIDGVAGMIEATLNKKLNSPQSAEFGTHETKTYCYKLAVLYVEEGAYLMVRRMKL